MKALRFYAIHCYIVFLCRVHYIQNNNSKCMIMIISKKFRIIIVRYLDIHRYTGYDVLFYPIHVVLLPLFSSPFGLSVFRYLR